jgi:uncharacterized protein (DUF433 family)/DNA-binding transcriptional MerR regulator
LSEGRAGLIALGEGIYTVPEVARILRPGMSVFKVRYWLHKGLLGEPYRWGSRGTPHLLTFKQLLRVRTIQHLRDELEFPLQKVTPVIAELSDFVFPRVFAEDWHELHFFPTQAGEIGVFDGEKTYEVKTGQLVIPETVLPEFEEIVRQARRDWVRREVDIEGFPRLVSNAGIVGGSPTIKGTRVETSFITHMAQSTGADKVLKLYPQIDRQALQQAAEFERVPLAA